MVITLGYFVVRLQELVANTDPVINNTTVYNYYGAEKGLNLYDSNHQIAISIIGNDKVPKHDPRYFRTIALHYDYNKEVDS